MTEQLKSASFPNGLKGLRTESEARGNVTMMDIINRGARPLPVVPKCCPFCGEDPPLAARKIGVNHILYIVGCVSDDCPATPEVSGETVDEAWSKWNARHG